MALSVAISHSHLGVEERRLPENVGLAIAVKVADGGISDLAIGQRIAGWRSICPVGGREGYGNLIVGARREQVLTAIVVEVTEREPSVIGENVAGEGYGLG